MIIFNFVASDRPTAEEMLKVSFFILFYFIYFLRILSLLNKFIASFCPKSSKISHFYASC